MKVTSHSSINTPPPGLEKRILKYGRLGKEVIDGVTNPKKAFEITTSVIKQAAPKIYEEVSNAKGPLKKVIAFFGNITLFNPKGALSVAIQDEALAKVQKAGLEPGDLGRDIKAVLWGDSHAVAAT